MKYNIGDIVEDDEGKRGHVVINWDEGLSPIEENAAHSDITVIGKWPDVSQPKDVVDAKEPCDHERRHYPWFLILSLAY